MSERIQSTREKTFLAACPMVRKHSPQTQSDVDVCTTLLILLGPAREWRQTSKKWLYPPFLQA